MRALVTIGLMAALVSSTAQAGHPSAPIPGVPAESFTRPGAPDWIGVLVITEANAAKSTFSELPVNFAGCVGNNGRPGCGVPAVFGWGTKLTVTSSLSANCCLTMTTTVTMGEPGTSAAFDITDASGPDGPCAGFALRGQDFRGSGGTKTVVVSQSQVSSRPGARTGVCSAPTAFQTSSGDLVFPPCVVGTDADCTDAGCAAGTTCVAGTTTTLAKSGAMLVCMSAEAHSNEVTVETSK